MLQSPCEPDDVAERLVCEAVATDGRDNTTALVFEVLPPDLLAE
jgi:serine/threonine protein phosphatase PrpC